MRPKLVEVEHQERQVQPVALGGGEVLAQALLEDLRAQEVGAVVVRGAVAQLLDLAQALGLRAQELDPEQELRVRGAAPHQVPEPAAGALGEGCRQLLEVVVQHDHRHERREQRARALDRLELDGRAVGQRIEQDHGRARGRAGRAATRAGRG